MTKLNYYSAPDISEEFVNASVIMVGSMNSGQTETVDPEDEMIW